MPARIVCISRTDVAHGEEVGKLVAARLGFRYVDEQVIEHAARLAQVDPARVAAVEQREPLLRRVIDKLAAARELVGPATLAVGAPLFGSSDRERGRITADDLRSLIQAAIHAIGREGDAVIVAHAASITLRDRGDVLRVLVTASAGTRAQRMAALRGVDAATAAAAVATGDRNREDYFRRFHGVAEEPTHYDLVVNTDVLAPELAADVIERAVRVMTGG